jgi:hypothetical protein
MCLGVIPQRKFGATGTTVGTVAKSVVITARRSGTGVTMGVGIAITGGTERPQGARWAQGLRMLSCKG